MTLRLGRAAGGGGGIGAGGMVDGNGKSGIDPTEDIDDCVCLDDGVSGADEGSWLSVDSRPIWGVY